ncbi:unnamed protein product [Prorocentrum cordatum]|uniref:Uncharacterized protein n=1 Tax=Prorocentrum cordatum TaxID=2364126 RepID=A0ABN9TV03_9DINO|nr:unnamed protein product [Polarella glacialis]
MEVLLFGLPLRSVAPTAYVPFVLSMRRAPLACRCVFFNNNPPPKPKRPQDQDLGPVLNTIKFFQDYSEKGSASIKGPLAGVPWVSLIFLTILGFTLNTFITQGGEGSMYDEMARKRQKSISGLASTNVDVVKSVDVRVVKDVIRE